MPKRESDSRSKEGVEVDTKRDGEKEDDDVGEIGARAIGEGGDCVHD